MDKDTRYKKDRAKREVADLDKEIAYDVADAQKKANEAVERRNYETACAFRDNPTYRNFLLQFMRAFWVWGEKNGLEFWQVGVDPKKTFMARNGKFVQLEACFTEKNPDPRSGERKTDAGLILPGGM